VSEYDAIVYDLDGTLVRLDVDWGAVREQTAAVLTDRGVEVGEADIWTIREFAADHDVLDRVDEVIAEFEREGARNATRLGLADDLPHGVPVGVCSLNAEEACHIALETHGIDEHVGTVVGRGTIETVKPEPEPLLHALERLGVEPADALFVGDSDTDRVAAERAGTAFQWAGDRDEH